MADQPNWKDVFDAVKDDCLVGLWSRGVELARDGLVAGEGHDAGEWTFRIRALGGGVAPTVRLYPEDAEWECDCGSRFDPCEHIAAGVIAVTASPEAASELFEGDSQNASIRYVLERCIEGGAPSSTPGGAPSATQGGAAGGTPGSTKGGTKGGTIVRRYIPTADGGRELLDRPLDGLATGARRIVAPNHDDLQIDRLIGRAIGSPLAFDRVTTLLRALVGVSDLRIGDDVVTASAEPLFPQAYIQDSGADGVELVVEADPSINEIFSPGILRRGNTLHPFGAQARFGQTWERLPFRRVFAKHEIPELVSTSLPELSKHITVDVRTARLPEKQGRVPVWVQFNVDLVDEGIDVLPLMVYDDPPVARIDGGRMVHLRGAVPMRDEARETELRLRLRDRLNLIPGRRVHLSGADAAKLLSDLESFDAGRPASASSPASSGSGDVVLGVRLETGENSEFTIVFEADGVSADATAVVSAWRNGIGLVPLSDGHFARIPAGWLDEHGHLVADLLAARALNDGHTPKAALPILGELCDALEAPEPVELASLRRLLADTPSDAVVHARPAAEIAGEICSDFRGELRGYQADGIAWLARLRDAGLGAVLADDMGLGKTIQALCVLRGRSLVVCPRSVIHNWTKELERFRPGLSVALYHGPRRTLDADADVTLTTYATLRNDAELMCETEWDVVVLDESQAIKNPDSQVARVAYDLNAQFRLSLSGTPIENRLDELWSQMHFTNRGLLGGRKDFARGYEAPIGLDDQSALLRLRGRIKPFLLRRLKKEVASELPPRTDAVLYCELEEHERAVYDGVRAATRDDVARELGQSGGVLKALEALLRLRQAACHSGLLPGRHAETSSKVEALCEALEDAVADGHKALVFSQWTGLLDKVEPQLRSRSLPFIRLDGSTRNRGAVVDAFQADDGPPVMIISLMAGGTGLNLTAADHVFLLDPWWNPAVEDQAADRAHRIGQDRPVMVYRMVAKDTVEERVLELQSRKRALADAALSGGAAGGLQVTRDDIMALLD